MTSLISPPESYAPGVPAEVQVPETAVPALLDHAAARYPERVALDFLGATTTYRALADQVERAAALLASAGVRPGDRVALVLPNCPQHVVAFYAALRLGAIVAEHNPIAPAAEVQAQLERHGARVVVAWEKSLPQIAPGGALGGRTVFSVDLTAGLPWHSRLLLRLPLKAARTQREAMRGPVAPGVRSWDHELAHTSATVPAGPPPRPGDLAALLHTGGTTGVPKAVMLTHRNLVANALQGLAWVQGLREGEETIAAALPFFHAFGLTLCLTFAVRLGATQVVLPRFDAGLLLGAHRRRPITFFPGVPPMFDRVARVAAEQHADLSSIRFSISGAMSLDGEIARRWEQTTGGLIIEGYGLTECSPVVLGSPLSERRRPGTLGLPFPSTEIRVVDRENPAVEVAPGEAGELLVRGPQVFAGYWERPDETAKVMLPGGWLRTGDVVRVTEGGFVVLVDRIKELILSGGFNVYPSQVEEAVRRVPGVKEVAVVGLPAGSIGERVVAALVLEPGAHVGLEEVRRIAQDHLSHYAMPQAVEIFDELPRSVLGKVLRRVVREQILARSTPARAA